ncbi:MAG: hypothetical protein WCS03_02155 [Bacteroidota bacterium]
MKKRIIDILYISKLLDSFTNINKGEKLLYKTLENSTFTNSAQPIKPNLRIGSPQGGGLRVEETALCDVLIIPHHFATCNTSYDPGFSLFTQ